MESVPGAVATGSQFNSENRGYEDDYPVASTTPRELLARGPRTAPGTDLVLKLRHLQFSALDPCVMTPAEATLRW